LIIIAKEAGMRQEEQVRIIKGLLHYLDTDTNVDAGGQVQNPVSSYTNNDIATKEWQSFFLNYTQVLGLASELPESGSFFTNNDLGKPILCTRDHDGKFHAFLNVCRHRGTIVESERRGKRNVFSCPFHAWSYSPKGDLVSVPREDHFGPVDKSCHGLVRLPAVEQYGMLWVHPDPDGEINLDQQLGGLADELASWGLEHYKHDGDTTYQTPMNWKLAIDTFGETYHFNVLHKNTLAENLYGNVQMYDTYERNHRMALCLKNIDSLRSEPEENWHILKAALPVYYIFPNIQLIMGGAGPTLVRVYPDGNNPHQSHSQISFYLSPEVQKMVLDPAQKDLLGSIQERMQNFASVIEMEDYRAAASSHLGAMSGAQTHFTFGRNEPALHHYHNTYRSALGLPPLDVLSN